ncbi:hypothetical protein HZC00_00130 [Candidatus Kaiserbacteria bacterium]|nr:hypothetical protein [Candidatus Kaiserbacteria bacterium]
MRSRFEHLQQKAISMRKHGVSIRDIETRLGIPRSTLSGWFHKVTLSDHHRKLLRQRHDAALVHARTKAVRWHNTQKKTRMLIAKTEARSSLENIPIHQKEVTELALAMLYLGEGGKKDAGTTMGNSDPMILRFFVDAISSLYGMSRDEFRCHLHLRADQDPIALTRFWSRALGIPRANFLKPLIDKRTVGSPTFPHYKGVCAVSCGRVAIQRKLMYIATTFCESIANGERAVSSVGRASH